jgi:hypothetical protein
VADGGWCKKEKKVVNLRTYKTADHGDETDGGGGVVVAVVVVVVAAE